MPDELYHGELSWHQANDIIADFRERFTMNRGLKAICNTKQGEIPFAYAGSCPVVLILPEPRIRMRRFPHAE